jgi:hypothetical protein
MAFNVLVAREDPARHVQTTLAEAVGRRDLPESANTGIENDDLLGSQANHVEPNA